MQATLIQMFKKLNSQLHVGIHTCVLYMYSQRRECTHLADGWWLRECE